MLTFFTFKHDDNNVFIEKEGILAHSMLIFTIIVQKIGYLRTYLTFCPHVRGVRLLGQGVDFLVIFQTHRGFLKMCPGALETWEGGQNLLFSMRNSGKG